MVLKVFIFFLLIEGISSSVLYIPWLTNNIQMIFSIFIMFFLTIVFINEILKKIDLKWCEITGKVIDTATVIKTIVIGFFAFGAHLIVIKFLLIILPNPLSIKIIEWLLKPNTSKMLILLAQFFETGFIYKLLAIILVFLLVSSEEVVFRGFIFNFIERRQGFLSALIYSSLLFGIGHMYIYIVLFSILGGLIYAISFRVSHNIFTPILAHGIFNCSMLFFWKDYISKWFCSG